ncbi:hypothetical protein Tco_1131917 [Tanacetum coccineum]|uniref:Uncharacterized protein n=1 Tax=Tanacetum coccineum TaxID=301880 RepID=A0ABQ5JAF9_9ASTR
MVGDCTCSCVDEVLDDGASWSRKFEQEYQLKLQLYGAGSFWNWRKQLIDVGSHTVEVQILNAFFVDA